MLIIFFSHYPVSRHKRAKSWKSASFLHRRFTRNCLRCASQS